MSMSLDLGRFSFLQLVGRFFLLIGVFCWSGFASMFGFGVCFHAWCLLGFAFMLAAEAPTAQRRAWDSGSGNVLLINLARFLPH